MVIFCSPSYIIKCISTFATHKHRRGFLKFHIKIGNTLLGEGEEFSRQKAQQNVFARGGEIGNCHKSFVVYVNFSLSNLALKTRVFKKASRSRLRTVLKNK